VGITSSRRRSFAGIGMLFYTNPVITFKAKIEIPQA
jgi:hypothetical protein